MALYYDAWISKRGGMSAVPLAPPDPKLSAPSATSSVRRFLALPLPASAAP